MPDTTARARLKEWLENGAARLHPLTFSQRELWEASAAPPAGVSNHICTFMEVHGEISNEDCIAAMQRVVDRHEVLRLSILPGKDGPLQLIRSSAAPAMEFHQLSAAEQKPEALEDRMRAVFEKPFDLLQGPLYRVEVLRRAPDDMVLVLAIHHAIADGWSLGVFVEDLCAAYLQSFLGGPLPAVPLSYPEWGAMERALWQPAKLDECARFWKAKLAGAARLWDGVDGPRTLVREVSCVTPEVTRSVRELARRADATLFSTLLTGFQIALAQWTGEPDIVVGTPVANRTKQAVRETMGYCAGVVPLRGHVEPDRPLEDSVRVTHEAVVDSFAHAMPFVELVRALGDKSAPDHNPIFDVRFALQNHPIPDAVAPGFAVQLHMRSTGTARFDLGCELTEDGDGLELVWLYRPARFSKSDIAELERLFLDVLAGACRSPQSRVAALTT
jgi:hypothetical protein